MDGHLCEARYCFLRVSVSTLNAGFLLLFSQSHNSNAKEDELPVKALPAQSL